MHTIKRLARIKRQEKSRTALSSFVRYNVISIRSLHCIRNFTTRWPKIVRKSIIHHSVVLDSIINHTTPRLLIETCPVKDLIKSVEVDLLKVGNVNSISKVFQIDLLAILKRIRSEQYFAAFRRIFECAQW